MRARFLLGQFQSQVDNALWTIESLDKARVETGLPDMQRIIIAVDPSGCSGPEDERSDEVGIVVAGLGVDGKGYVLEDLSGRFAPGGQNGWGNIVATAFDRHDADCVVAETNYGGAMVQEVMKTARPRTPFHEVKASRGKAVRAEPVALLFDHGKAMLAGTFPKLEDQLCSFTTAGYMGDRSPDRADAMVWALSEIFPAIARDRKIGPVVHEGAAGYRAHSGAFGR
ncbi:phage terminase large subunit family protein [Bradyrhizobium ottawaense]